MNRLILAAICTVMAAAVAAAQHTMPLWDSIPYDNGHDNNPEITVYHPADSTANGQAIVICPGGGYVLLATNHEGHMIARMLADHGVTAAVLKYRLPHGNRHIPAADACQAIRLMRTNAAGWHIDPHRIGIMGSSAGGHLASTVCTHITDTLSRPDFAILFYPVISSDSTITHSGSIKNLLGTDSGTPHMRRLYSNELHVSADTPPTLLLLSDDDTTVPPANSIRYYQALKDHGIPASMHIFPSGGHGWGFRPTFRYHPQVSALILDWLSLFPANH